MIKTLWEEMKREFRRSESQYKVALALLNHGLSIRVVRRGVERRVRIYLGSIEIPYKSLAEACGVDWRTVKSALDKISKNPFLREFFENIENAGPFFRGVVDKLGYRCIVVETKVDKPGIIAYVTRLLADKNVNILQVIAEHPLISTPPKLHIIIEGEVPGEVIPQILKHEAISKISVY
ncbi:MAG: hypothetical protein DRJ49_01700 [Thermoprotei archaeon]|nr:MAG: hypothetical protein DRJ49_01700 [Thermoprotei archaeon]